ncbi:MAG: CPBP family intramembrane glutamic endopeptidase [Gemmatimonadaceae bacterium]
MPIVTAPSLSSRSAQSYWAAARSPRYSLVFALPLLVLYEVLAAMRPGRGPLGDVRNGADVMLRSIFSLVAGAYGSMVFLGVVIVISLLLIRRDVRANGGVRTAVFLGMSAESVGYALAFGLVVGTLTARLLGSVHALAIAGDAQQLDGTTKFVVSLGAGLYEELLFRVLLVSALSWIARAVFGWKRLSAGIFATLVGAVLFSAAHYVGPLGDRLGLQSFVFRAIGGVAFSALYLTRGFGITAWTHALYDVLLLSSS